MSVKNINIAFLGTGYIAGVHAKALSKIPGTSISAVCSIRIESASALVNSLDCNAVVYDNFDTMLNCEQIDALYVCLPPFAHEGQLEKAVAKGIHIFVEKPIGLSTSRAQEMAMAVKKAGVIGQVGYHMRFGLAVQKLKNLIESGAAGKPTLFNAFYACNSLHGQWWREKEKSGGQVFEQAIHLYDLALYFFGAPHCVNGITRNICHKEIPDYTIEDTSASIISFKSGAVASIAATNCAIPMQWTVKFTVVCEKLTAVFSDANRADFFYTHGENLTSEVICGYTDSYYEETMAFIESLRNGKKSAVPMEDGVIGVSMVESVCYSSESGGQTVIIA